MRWPKKEIERNVSSQKEKKVSIRYRVVQATKNTRYFMAQDSISGFFQCYCFFHKFFDAKQKKPRRFVASVSVISICYTPKFSYSTIKRRRSRRSRFFCMSTRVLQSVKQIEDPTQRDLRV